MFEKFTERAKKVMSLARQEAQRLDAVSIGTEHVLLGIIQEGGGVAAKVLKNMQVDLKRLRQEIDKHLGAERRSMSSSEIPISEPAKDALRMADEFACKLGHDVVGTEHVLMGVLQETRGLAGMILSDMRIKADEVRDMVLEVLGADVEYHEKTVGIDLPSSSAVRKVMEQIGDLASERQKQLADLAKDYGLHGEPLKLNTVEFRITRTADEWGVYVRNASDNELRHITKCRVEEKMEFLEVADKMENSYRKRIVKMFEEANTKIRKSGKNGESLDGPRS